MVRNKFAYKFDKEKGDMAVSCCACCACFVCLLSVCLFVF